MGAEQTQTPTKMENTITFGLENVHWGKVTKNPNGTIDYTKPEKMSGAVDLELNPVSTEIKLKADNIDYYVSESNEGYTGKMTFYNVTESFAEYVSLLILTKPRRSKFVKEGASWSIPSVPSMK